MRVIIKILEYLPERDGVIFRSCRLNSPKPIDEYPEKVVDCHDLNKNDTEDFIQSLVDKVSEDRINEQDEDEGILDENIPIQPTGELDFDNIIGKIFQARPTTRKSRPLKVRRIEL
mgnify:FL=1|tara:strand:+ start:497 stop:844 length:348 start_codon:yes stop_codon:yes gene_type:complete